MSRAPRNARTEIWGDPKLHAKQAAELRDAANLYWLKAQFRAATLTARGKPLETPARAVVIAMQADMTNFDDDERQFIGKHVLALATKAKLIATDLLRCAPPLLKKRAGLRGRCF